MARGNLTVRTVSGALAGEICARPIAVAVHSHSTNRRECLGPKLNKRMELHTLFEYDERRQMGENG